MDFDLTDEQRMLKDSIDGLLANKYDFSKRNAAALSTRGWSEEIWRSFAELGFLAAPFSEEDGGFGAGAVEQMLIMESLGRALSLEPYLATVVIGGGFLRHGTSAEQRAAYIPGIIDGSKTLAFAQLERQSRYDLEDVETSAERNGSGYIITGAKRVVLHGDTASAFIVTARTAGGRRDQGGIGVFVVPATAPGVSVRGYSTQDAMRAADVTFDKVEVGGECVLGDPENALPLVEKVVDEARIALCAEALGAMDEALKITLDYLRTRNQFDAPLSSFQALKHRAADMFIELEQSRGMLFYASMSADLEQDMRSRAVSAAKVQIGRSSRFIGQQSVQLHGGIGMTMEAQIGHYFKRTTMIENTFGDVDFHLARLVSQKDANFVL